VAVYQAGNPPSSPQEPETYLDRVSLEKPSFVVFSTAEMAPFFFDRDF
jgi:hypothetical protein